MSAHVLLNLLNELGKRDKMRGLPSILSLFRNKFNKFNKTRARVLNCIKITLKSHYCRKNVIILSLCTQRCSGRQSKYGCKDQESIQSSTTPDPGYQWESDKLTEDTTNESQEVSPFPAGSTYKQTRTKHSKHKTEQKHKRSTKEVPPWNGQ